MFKNKTTILIIVFSICSNSSNYAMRCEDTIEDIEDEWGEEECGEGEKAEPLPYYLKQLSFKLTKSIQASDVENFNKTISEMKLNLVSARATSFLKGLDIETGQTPLSLAKALPKSQNRRYIVKTLKQHGVQTLISDKHYQNALENLDNKMLAIHKQLIESIETGSIEYVQKVLNYAFATFGCILYAKNDIERQKPIYSNFQVIVLLNESAPNGYTPLTLALERKFLDIAEILIKHGASPRKLDKNRYKPADIAWLALGLSNEEFVTRFNIKKTLTEISEEYLKSPAHLKLLQEIEEKKKVKKEKRKKP